MSYASLVTCEAVANTLSREGCHHFEAFKQSNEDFDRGGGLEVEDTLLNGLLARCMIGCAGSMVVLSTGRGLAGRWSRCFLARRVLCLYSDDLFPVTGAEEQGG